MFKFIKDFYFKLILKLAKSAIEKSNERELAAKKVQKWISSNGEVLRRERAISALLGANIPTDREVYAMKLEDRLTPRKSVSELNWLMYVHGNSPDAIESRKLKARYDKYATKRIS